MLAQDPRPRYQEDPQRVYGFGFAGMEIKFSVSADMKLNSFVTVADATKVKVYMKNFGEFYNNQIESAADSNAWQERSRASSPLLPRGCLSSAQAAQKGSARLCTLANWGLP